MPILFVSGYVELCNNKLCPFCKRLYLRTSEIIRHWIPIAHGFNSCPRYSINSARQPGRIFCGGMSELTLNGVTCFAPTGTYQTLFFNPPHALVDSMEYYGPNPSDIRLPSYGPTISMIINAQIMLCDNYFCDCCNDVSTAFSNFFQRITFKSLGLEAPVLPYYQETIKHGWNFYRCGGYVNFEINGYKESFYLGKKLPNIFNMEFQPFSRSAREEGIRNQAVRSRRNNGGIF